MKEHFVNYNQALALKELGFDEPCIARYIIPGDLVFKGCYEDSNIIHLELTQNDICEAHVLAPLKSQVFKWFRENYKIQSLIQEYLLNTYMYTIDDGINNDILVLRFETYEQADSACIDKLIEIVKAK